MELFDNKLFAKVVNGFQLKQNKIKKSYSVKSYSIKHQESEKNELCRNRGVGKGGLGDARPPPTPRPLFCGVDIFPIKKLLKISAVINVRAILGSTSWRCSGKKLFLKIAVLKQKKTAS